MSPWSTTSSSTSFLTCPGLLGPQPCDRLFPGSGHPERAAGPKPHWCPHSLLHKELSRHSLTPPRGGWWRSHPSAVRRTSKESKAVLNIHQEHLMCPRTTKSHQDLEQDHEQLVTGHEVTVQDAQVEPAAQTAEHFDEHLLVTPCFLHT